MPLLFRMNSSLKKLFLLSCLLPSIAFAAEKEEQTEEKVRVVPVLRTPESNNVYVKMIFPKDELAGGTWIGASEKNTMVCLLNGGFKNHKRLSNYRHSRGVVVKDFLLSDDIFTTIQEYNLDAIEPFTVVAVDWNKDLKLYELVWDGSQKHIQELPLTAHIWSSSTLYTDEMKQLRRNWFSDFKEHHVLDENTMLDFHQNAGIGDANVDTLMNRGFVKTVSITQIQKNTSTLKMQYLDIASQETSETSLLMTAIVHE